MKTVAAVFPSLESAQRATRHLENLGIPPEDISVVAGGDDSLREAYMHEAKLEEGGTGRAAAIGASVGGGVAVAASLIALAIPGVGPVIAGGALAAILTTTGIGAAGGGLIGAFINLGISHDDAHLYEEALRRGAVCVAVHVDDPMEETVALVLVHHGASGINDQAEIWRKDGWTHPYPSDSSIRWHEPAE